MTVGVLALQGAFRAHLLKLRLLEVEAREVRTAADLEGVTKLVIPGGESTTISMLLESSQLFDPIAERIQSGMPVFGTCAGLILLATTIEDGRDDQRSFSALDVDVVRNGYGRQAESFETQVPMSIADEPFHAVFIRAPRVQRAGPGVEVLASVDGEPVLIRQGSALGAAFHPELSEDLSVHRYFVDSVA